MPGDPGWLEEASSPLSPSSSLVLSPPPFLLSPSPHTFKASGGIRSEEAAADLDIITGGLVANSYPPRCTLSDTKHSGGG